MKAKGEQGELFKTNIIELLDTFDEEEELSVITNSKVYRSTKLSKIKNDLIKLGYTANEESINSVLLKVNSLFNKENGVKRDLYLVSDFQNHLAFDTTYVDTSISVHCIQTRPVQNQNISLDSAYFTKNEVGKTRLTIVVKNQNSKLKSIPISITNNGVLINKVSCSLTETRNTVSVDFFDEEALNLTLSINSNDIDFDNTLYITKQKSKPINVLSIGDASKNGYLKKLYNGDEFIYKNVNLNQIDFSTFERQGLIVLNEINTYSSALIQNITRYLDSGGYLIFIPSSNSKSDLLNSLGLKATETNNGPIRLTGINYSHPLLNNVFERQVSNFDYPEFKSHFRLSQYSSRVLSLENGNPFLVNKNNIYAFSSPISNSNFTQSSLIVPIFYNIAKVSQGLDSGYYTVGKPNKIPVDISILKDDVLSLHNKNSTFIPIQTIKAKSVVLSTEDMPEFSGLYKIKTKDTTTVTTLSYNYNRLESDLQYKNFNFSPNSAFSLSNSLKKSINRVNSANEVQSIWKWFVIFALLFLVIELLILKYFK